MKKPSVNSKSFWQDNTTLKIEQQRQWIEFLVEKKRVKESKFSFKLAKLLKKIF